MKVHYSWIALLIAAAKSCLLPGWPSSLEFVFACGLVAFFLWIESKPKAMTLSESKTLKDMNEALEKIEHLRNEFTDLKMKIGFRIPRAG